MIQFYLIKKTQSLPDKTLRNPVANEEQQWIELTRYRHISWQTRCLSWWRYGWRMKVNFFFLEDYIKITYTTNPLTMSSAPWALNPFVQVFSVWASVCSTIYRLFCFTNEGEGEIGGCLHNKLGKKMLNKMHKMCCWMQWTEHLTLYITTEIKLMFSHLSRGCF